MSVTISALQRCPVNLLSLFFVGGLQLCVVGLISYLCYLCLLPHSSVKYEMLTLCEHLGSPPVFLFCYCIVIVCVELNVLVHDDILF